MRKNGVWDRDKDILVDVILYLDTNSAPIKKWVVLEGGRRVWIQ